VQLITDKKSTHYLVNHQNVMIDRKFADISGHGFWKNNNTHDNSGQNTKFTGPPHLNTGHKNVTIKHCH